MPNRNNDDIGTGEGWNESEIERRRYLGMPKEDRPTTDEEWEDYSKREHRIWQKKLKESYRNPPDKAPPMP